MSFNIGDYVVYGGYEICRIEEKVKRCFDGTTPREYYKLIPVYSKGSTYYIPSDDYEEKIRRLLSKEEIYALIEEMPNAEAERLMHHEFAFVLGIDEEDIGKFIEDKISAKSAD